MQSWSCKTLFYTYLHLHFVINLIYNGTTILISEQQVLSRLNTEYQHIIIMHIDNRYKWKPIREKTTSYYCCDAKASSKSLSPLIFCRLQPTGGYYLNFASCNLQGSSNSHLFSADYNLQEAPTSILQATTCKEAPNPICFL